MPETASVYSAELIDSLCTVLCWVLNHTHNDRFEKFLKILEKFYGASGFELVDMGAIVIPCVHCGALVENLATHVCGPRTRDEEEARG